MRQLTFILYGIYVKNTTSKYKPFGLITARESLRRALHPLSMKMNLTHKKSLGPRRPYEFCQTLRCAKKPGAWWPPGLLLFAAGDTIVF